MTTRRRRPSGIIHEALERRRREEADVRPRRVVGAAGVGRHVLEARDGGPPFIASGPGFTFRPGALVPTATHTNLDDREVLLAQAAARGASEYPAIRASGQTAAPVPTPPGTVITTEIVDIWAIYLDDDGFPFSGRFRVARLDLTGAFSSWVGPTINSPSFGSTPPNTGSWFLADDRFYCTGATGTVAIALIDATDGSESTISEVGDWRVSGRGVGYGSSFWWVERDVVASPAKVRCLVDTGGALSPTTVAEVNLPRASTSVNVRTTRLGADLNPLAIVQLSGPTEYYIVDFGAQTATAVPNESPENQTRGRDAPGQVGSGESYFSWDTVGKLAQGDPNEAADHWPSGWGGRDGVAVSVARDVLWSFDESSNPGSWNFRASTAEEPAGGWPAVPEVCEINGLSDLYLHPTDSDPSGDPALYVQLREA